MFAKGSLRNEVNGKYARASGATPTEDRFGNSNSAYYLQGNPDSYINLGTGSELKPKKGSISIWVKISQPILKGTGFKHNPILHTKTFAYDKFNDAFFI